MPLSWYTQDTSNRIIFYDSEYKEFCFTVYMKGQDGKCFKENKYKGDGVFGGKNYFEYLAELNGYTDKNIMEVKSNIEINSLEDIGYAIYNEFLQSKKYDKVIYPNLLEHKSSTYKPYFKAVIDPNQGFYSNFEEEESEYKKKAENEAYKHRNSKKL